MSKAIGLCMVRKNKELERLQKEIRNNENLAVFGKPNLKDMEDE
jgi:hypothetical protein